MSRGESGRHLRGKVAVAGIGNTKRWDAPGRSAFDQLGEAVQLALGDAGLRKQDVDGLFCTLSVSGFPLLNVAERLGLQPRYFDGSMVGGSSFFGHVRSALLAIEAGLCSVALICYGSNQRSAGGKLVSLPDPQPAEAPYNPLYPISSYALAAARHMYDYGTTREQLAEVALAARAWAQRNPAAFKREPLSRDEVLASRPVSDPLTRADCCLVTDGGGALILVSAERAKDLPAPPVYLLGVGAALSHRQIANMPDLTTTCAVNSGQQAYAMAGLGPKDIPMAQLYDAFTINTLLFLEDLGFCPKGEGGRFVEEGGIAPGGRLAVNTNGGGLSCNHPGMYGLFPMIEAVEQLRGQAGERQVMDVEVALAHGNGGVLSSQATAIFGTAAAL
ncbi:thiolase [Aquibaculum arenosum]|uniref:Thiolase n=1 Tax=Aquibaculum arenosum TaxID=3032591 RepID=A0ABT5YPA9_9PROT|nr:thiolase [Fodinicurvata sp. CAU 1616]MDF2096626.1 thiolase [Fodinicurvata sp. CAU 1616]